MIVRLIESEQDDKTSNINWSNWRQEDLDAKLKERLAANAQLGANAKRPFDVEAQFFKEFFLAVSNNNNQVAEKLILLGELLKKAIKVLSFKPEVNPILGFLSNEYVQKELLIPGLLNADTFKAIYNAVAQDVVADSEFQKDNDFNLIYCKNLYKKPPKEIYNYLKLQSTILKADATVYTKKDQENNKKVFTLVKNIDERDIKSIQKYAAELKSKEERLGSLKEAELNSHNLATEIKVQLLGGGKVRQNDLEHLTTKALEKIMAELNTPADFLAALIMIANTTGNQSAKNAMKNDKFGAVSMGKLIDATIKLDSFMPDRQIDNASAKGLVAAITQKANIM